MPATPPAYDGETYANTASWLLHNPVLLALIAMWVGGLLSIELAWYQRHRRAYDRAEATRSLQSFALVGIGQVAMTGLLLPVLFWIWPHRLQTLDMRSPMDWAFAWVVTDFVYYWIHRMLHVTRIGWALHAPHHSLRQMSLLDSLRTSWGEQPVGVLAYGVPLVLAGVPPWIAGGFYVFVALYQFAVHTEMDWSLGPFDRVIYTPAAHRLHHATNWPEANSNYGGFFLLWDRAFRTWRPTTPSDRPAEYGLPGPQPQSLRAVVFGEMEALWARVRALPGLGPRLRLLLGQPRDDAAAGG